MADEQKAGSKQKIARLEKGNTTRTARHAAVMNEIIDAINARYALKVSPDDAGKFFFSDSNAVLALGDVGGGCGGDPPATGTYVCGAIDGITSWLATQECACGVDGGSA